MLRRLDVEDAFRVYQIYGGMLEQVGRTMPKTTDVLVDTDALIMEALYRKTYYLVVPIQFPDLRDELCMLLEDVRRDLESASLIWTAIRNGSRWRARDLEAIEELAEGERAIVASILACTRPYLRLIA